MSTVRPHISCFLIISIFKHKTLNIYLYIWLFAVSKSGEKNNTIRIGFFRYLTNKIKPKLQVMYIIRIFLASFMLINSQKNAKLNILRKGCI